jgi:hypothetical protein
MMHAGNLHNTRINLHADLIFKGVIIPIKTNNTRSDLCTKIAFKFTLQYAFNVQNYCRYKSQTPFSAVQLIYSYIQCGSVFKTHNQNTPSNRYGHIGYKNVPNRIHVHLGQLGVHRSIKSPYAPRNFLNMEQLWEHITSKLKDISIGWKTHTSHSIHKTFRKLLLYSSSNTKSLR